MELRTKGHPQANGRRPKATDEQWVVQFLLETGEPLVLRMGRKDRDTLFGMLIADCHEHQEAEPA